MKYIHFLFILRLAFTSNACAPSAAVTSAPPPAAEPTTEAVNLPIEEPTTIVKSPAPGLPTPTESIPPPDEQRYYNDSFGLGFHYPAGWYGPDQYISGETLRLAIGSNVVFPYGQMPDCSSGAKNTYHVVIQYTRHEQNAY